MSPNPQTKDRFVKAFKKHFFLRGHMSVILAATGMSGVVVNKLLFSLGLKPLWTRYPLAVVCAYAVFLGLVRLWLAIVIRRESRNQRRLVDSSIDLGGEFVPSFNLDSSVAEWKGAGGEFSGGGASASWSEGTEAQKIQPAMSGMVKRRAAAPAQKAGSKLFNMDLDIDGDGIVVVIAFVILVLAILGAGIYTLWEAPLILAETAFQFCLASSLAAKLRKSDTTDWLGHLTKLTWKSFAVVLFLSIVFAGVAKSYRPDAVRLRDLMSLSSSHRSQSSDFESE